MAKQKREHKYADTLPDAELLVAYLKAAGPRLPTQIAQDCGMQYGRVWRLLQKNERIHRHATDGTYSIRYAALNRG